LPLNPARSCVFGIFKHCLVFGIFPPRTPARPDGWASGNGGDGRAGGRVRERRGGGRAVGTVTAKIRFEDFM